MGTDHNSFLRMNKDMTRDKLLSALHNYCDEKNEGKISMESLSMHDPIIAMLDDPFRGGELHIELENREVGLLAGSVMNGTILLHLTEPY